MDSWWALGVGKPGSHRQTSKDTQVGQRKGTQLSLPTCPPHTLSGSSSLYSQASLHAEPPRQSMCAGSLPLPKATTPAWGRKLNSPSLLKQLVPERTPSRLVWGLCWWEEPCLSHHPLLKVSHRRGWAGGLSPASVLSKTFPVGKARLGP